MQKYAKTGLLILTLVFPVLIFIFLKVFTTNRYDLPFFAPERDALTQEIRIVEGDTVYQRISNFSLPSPTGTPITQAKTFGQTMVVANLSGASIETAQEVIAHLSRVAGLLSDYPRLSLLSLVDSTQSTLEADIRQAQNFGERWLVAVAPAATLDGLLRTTFHLGTNANTGQTISPDARLSLVDSEGYIRGYYDALDPEETERLMAEIRILEHNRTEK